MTMSPKKEFQRNCAAKLSVSRGVIERIMPSIVDHLLILLIAVVYPVYATLVWFRRDKFIKGKNNRHLHINLTIKVMRYRLILYIVAVLVLVCPSWAQVERIWLTHETNKPSEMVINWETVTPGHSIVLYGPTEKYEKSVRLEETTSLHHVNIPLSEQIDVYHYRVITGKPL
jgi:hypothetical protein